MIRIRRMEAKDTSGMHEVHTTAVRQVCATSLAPTVIEAWLYGRTPDGYLRAAEQDGEVFWVAVDSTDQVLGFGSWRENEFLSLFVDPRFHGRGIGRKLFSTCEKDAAKNGHAIRRLISTLNAQSYYVALGFRAIRRSYREKRGQRIPHIEMIRDQTSCPDF